MDVNIMVDSQGKVKTYDLKPDIKCGLYGAVTP
jgi:hypothetical protein